MLSINFIVLFDVTLKKHPRNLTILNIKLPPGFQNLKHCYVNSVK